MQRGSTLHTRRRHFYMDRFLENISKNILLIICCIKRNNYICTVFINKQKANFMKKLLSTSLVLISFAVLSSCTKTTDTANWGFLNQTFGIDSLKQNMGNNVFTVYHFDKNPETAKNWSIQFWWADGYGFNFPPPENIGHGIRLTPIDPADENGEQVPQYFTWHMEDGTLDKKPNGDLNGAIIEDNYAIVTVYRDYIIIHQIPRNPGEIEQWYYCHAKPNGADMKNLGPKLPG